MSSFTWAGYIDVVKHSEIVIFVVRYTEQHTTENFPQFQPISAYNCHLIPNNDYDCEFTDGCVLVLL
jgi:hypothetical protein